MKTRNRKDRHEQVRRLIKATMATALDRAHAACDEGMRERLFKLLGGFSEADIAKLHKYEKPLGEFLYRVWQSLPSFSLWRIAGPGVPLLRSFSFALGGSCVIYATIGYTLQGSYISSTNLPVSDFMKGVSPGTYELLARERRYFVLLNIGAGDRIPEGATAHDRFMTALVKEYYRLTNEFYYPEDHEKELLAHSVKESR